MAAAILLAGVLAVVLRSQSPKPASWADGSQHGRWLAVYNGYGTTAGGDTQVSLAPHPPASVSDADTHAALVVSRQSYDDVEATVRVRTQTQLRPNQPNPWEVGWVLWHYSDRFHFYAVTLKPTGWELSKEDPQYPGDQRFLASGSTPTFPIGQWHTVKIVQLGNRITLYADGRLLTQYTDRQAPYLRGAIGLYTEDARVQFTYGGVGKPQNAVNEGVPEH